MATQKIIKAADLTWLRNYAAKAETDGMKASDILIKVTDVKAVAEELAPLKLGRVMPRHAVWTVVQAWRKAKIDQVTIGTALGISQPTISRVEKEPEPDSESDQGTGSGGARTKRSDDQRLRDLCESIEKLIDNFPPSKWDQETVTAVNTARIKMQHALEPAAKLTAVTASEGTAGTSTTVVKPERAPRAPRASKGKGNTPASTPTDPTGEGASKVAELLAA